MKFSQRRSLFAAMGIAAVILVIFFGIIPLFDAKKEAEEEITMKRSTLLKYEQFLRNRKTIEEELGRTVKLYEEAQQKLLSGDTPQLGAANLQEDREAAFREEWDWHPEFQDARAKRDEYLRPDPPSH